MQFLKFYLSLNKLRAVFAAFFSASRIDEPLALIFFKLKTFSETVNTGECEGPSFFKSLYSGSFFDFC